MHNKMEHNWAFGIGVITAIGTAYGLYKLLKKKSDKNITTIEKIDYELLYNWLKNEYRKKETQIANGSKFGIMPSSIAKETYVEDFSKEVVLLKGQDIVCVFILDSTEENVISKHYFVFNEMGQSLKDILHSDKIYIQPLKK